MEAFRRQLAASRLLLTGCVGWQDWDKAATGPGTCARVAHRSGAGWLTATVPATLYGLRAPWVGDERYQGYVSMRSDDRPLCCIGILAVVGSAWQRDRLL